MLFKNTLAQSSSVFVGYAFSFILAPIMIARLGLDAFGVWAVTGAFATYAGLLDLGISRALARFVAVYDVEGDDRRMRECVGLGLIAITIVGVLAAGVAVALAPVLSDQLGVLSTADMRWVSLAAVGIWTFNGYDRTFAAIGIGKRQMVPPNVAITVNVTINFVFSLIALALSSSLVVYGYANAAASAAGLIPTFLAMRYVWRSPYIALPSRQVVKDVLSFSLKSQVGWIADLVNFQTDKIIIAVVVDVRAAAAYEIASRVVMAVRSAAVMTVSAMITHAAAEITTAGREVIGGMYRRYLLRSCGLSFPLFALVAVSAPFLLIAWLGEAPGDSALIVPFLTLAYVINITTGAGSTIAMGAGHPGLVSVNAIIVAALNVALTIALAGPFGLWGVVGGTFIAVSFGGLWFNARFLRLFKLPLRDYLAGTLPTGVLAFGLAIPLAVFTIAVGLPGDRLTAILCLAGVTIAYAAPYWLIATRRGFLPRQLEFRPFRPDEQVEGVT
jgi:O-antigen/teichoic acid export membrane protein